MRFFLAAFFLFALAGNTFAADRRQKLVDDAVADSIKIIDKALEKNSPLQEVLLQMRESFSDVRFLPWGQDFPQCGRKEGIRAFVVRNSGVIRICASVFKDEWDKKQLTQVLLHESAHVAGIHDECIATKYEIGAMKLAKKPFAFRNDYWKECKITTKFDPFQIVTPPLP